MIWAYLKGNLHVQIIKRMVLSLKKYWIKLVLQKPSMIHLVMESFRFCHLFLLTIIPFYLNFSHKKQIRCFRRIYSFEALLFTYQDCGEVIQEAWSQSPPFGGFTTLKNKLKSNMLHMKSWSTCKDYITYASLQTKERLKMLLQTLTTKSIEEAQVLYKETNYLQERMHLKW